MRARRAALSRGCCAVDGRRPVVEFVASPRQVGLFHRLTNQRCYLHGDPRKSPRRTDRPEEWGHSATPPVFFSDRQFSVASRHIHEFHVNDREETRYCECRSAVWTLLQSVIVESTESEGVKRKGMIVGARVRRDSYGSSWRVCYPVKELRERCADRCAGSSNNFRYVWRAS